MKKLLFLLLFFATFVACSDDDNTDYDPSKHIDMIVVNEGAATTGSGALSVIYDDRSTTVDLFQDVNNRPLGDIAQSITYINGNYFVALNGSKKVEIVEPQTFNSIATIVFEDSNISPRFIQPISATEAIVSSLGRELARINIKDYSVIEYIDISETEAMQIEKMITIDKKLFCAAIDKGIGVFDVDNIKGSSMRLVEGLQGSIMKTAKPILDKNHKLWILTTESDKVILNGINPETEKVEDTIEIPYVKEGDKDYVDDCITGTDWYTRMDTDRTKSKLYFYMTILSEKNSRLGAIFTMDVDSHEIALYRRLPDLGMMYGMGISPDGDVFLCDCLDYSRQRGFLREYKENGSIVSQRVGVYPRMIHFTEYDK